MRQPRGSLFWFLFSFRGRISRIEFWVFHLAAIVLGFVLLVVLGLTYRPMFYDSGAAAATLEILIGYAMIGLSGLTTWAALAVAAKRFHDRGRSGWWSLIGFVPVIGTLWILVECGCLRGTTGDNRFGPDPLGGQTPGLSEVFE